MEGENEVTGEQPIASCRRADRKARMGAVTSLGFAESHKP